MIYDSDGTLQNLFISAVEILRQPAGKKYSSMDDIKRNREQFVKDFHRGLFFLHILTIDAIIHAEGEMGILESNKDRENNKAIRGWKHIRQIFRSINDSIIWVTHPEAGFFIRRTCRKQPRGKLRDQNHESVLAAMRQLFAGGKVLPVWNDATRCLDIGDITLLSPDGISFYELKTGKVNDHILDMMTRTDPQQILAELDLFFGKYGKKGMDQIDRIIKQKDKMTKLTQLSEKDNVFDPFLGANRFALTPNQPPETYDSELSPLLEELRSRDFVSHSIDNCLHILALNRIRDISAADGRKIMKEHLQDKLSRPGEGQVECRDIVLSLESSFDYPTAKPIMLRDWSSEDIARIGLGHTEIYFAFDVNSWGKNLESSRLVWSSQSEGRKELSKAPDERLFLVQNRIPQIVGPNGRIIHLGTQFLQIMLCEGIRPLSLASYYDQIISSSSLFEEETSREPNGPFG